MPPQPGIFSLPYASTHKARIPHAQDSNSEMSIAYHPHHHHHHHHHHHSLDDGKKERKRKEIAGKLGKEMNDASRRNDGRDFNEGISALQGTAIRLCTRPETVPLYPLRLYPLSIERSALLVQHETQERHALDGAQTAYEEEREKVEDEWRRGRDRVRERLLEGIEERRRRAREEKEGEGTLGDASLDSQSRPHITRKLRNKIGTSPPPTPLGTPGFGLLNGLGLSSGLPITTGPFTNPHSLAVDELPSPFPLPLTSTIPTNGASGNGVAGAGGMGNGGRRRVKGTSHQSQAGVGGLGKSLAILAAGCKESEVEGDLGEIRRGNKRRRAAVSTTV